VTAVESRSVSTDATHGITAAAPGPDYAEMMARYLGPVVVGAIADDDVTEVYVNPQDGRVRVDTHSAGKRDTGHHIATERLEMFLNAAASAPGVAIGPANPQLQAELPAHVFRGARLQGFLPPLSPGVAVTIRKRPTRVYPLGDYVARGALPET
jgi:type IV secretion system protein TrbB